MLTSHPVCPPTTASHPSSERRDSKRRTVTVAAALAGALLPALAGTAAQAATAQETLAVRHKAVTPGQDVVFRTEYDRYGPHGDDVCSGRVRMRFELDGARTAEQEEATEAAIRRAVNRMDLPGNLADPSLSPDQRNTAGVDFHRVAEAGACPDWIAHGYDRRLWPVSDGARFAIDQAGSLAVGVGVAATIMAMGGEFLPPPVAQSSAFVRADACLGAAAAGAFVGWRHGRAWQGTAVSAIVGCVVQNVPAAYHDEVATMSGALTARGNVDNAIGAVMCGGRPGARCVQLASGPFQSQLNDTWRQAGQRLRS